MRPIKFKARINEAGREAHLSEWQYFTPYELGRCPELLDFIDPETMCQFTGLLDRNGKEIYEGDIVRYDDYQGVAEVGFRRIEFVEEVEFKGGCFYPVCNQPPYTFEVIGSIYENPELLTDKP